LQEVGGTAATPIATADVVCGYLPRPIRDLARAARKRASPRQNFSRSEGNSPQFDEKAEIFRGHDQHWNEAIGLDHGHANRHAL
jgi:hypothetical protein